MNPKLQDSFTISSTKRQQISLFRVTISQDEQGKPSQADFLYAASEVRTLLKGLLKEGIKVIHHEAISEDHLEKYLQDDRVQRAIDDARAMKTVELAICLSS
ncbi:MAG: hypothetical protein AB7J40_01440 [Candidatus Altimarinota bacterium]